MCLLFCMPVGDIPRPSVCNAPMFGTLFVGCDVLDAPLRRNVTSFLYGYENAAKIYKIANRVSAGVAGCRGASPYRTNFERFSVGVGTLDDP